MTEEQNGSVPESGTKKPEQATVKKKAAAKSNASLGEQYLGALFKCASWISPAYKEMAEKAKGKLEVLKELYLCSCDGVSEEKALETLDKDNPEVMLRFIRQKCVEERATKGYEEELKEIRKAAALVRHEMQDIGNDIELANYIEQKIVEEHYSPGALIGEMRRTGMDKKFKVSICEKTVYNYIDKGIFLSLTNKDLPIKGKKKRIYKKVHIQKRLERGTSIEERPKRINFRKEFGHWEMDSVVGRRGNSKKTLLTLTERKTRREYVFLQRDKSAGAVVDSLDMLERRWGKDLFRKVFKTITVDNGTEFSDCSGIERSVYGGNRTKVYYCHPYCSWERGTNENTNRMVRRQAPKGTSFENMTEEEVQCIEDWVNQYPRKTFEYATSGELFTEEMRLLI